MEEEAHKYTDMSGKVTLPEEREKVTFLMMTFALKNCMVGGKPIIKTLKKPQMDWLVQHGYAQEDPDKPGNIATSFTTSRSIFFFDRASSQQHEEACKAAGVEMLNTHESRRATSSLDKRLIDAGFRPKDDKGDFWEVQVEEVQVPITFSGSIERLRSEYHHPPHPPPPPLHTTPSPSCCLYALTTCLPYAHAITPTPLDRGWPL